MTPTKEPLKSKIKPPLNPYYLSILLKNLSKIVSKLLTNHPKKAAAAIPPKKIYNIKKAVLLINSATMLSIFIARNEENHR